MIAKMIPLSRLVEYTLASRRGTTLELKQAVSCSLDLCDRLAEQLNEGEELDELVKR
jgi:hypothetical protein